MGTKGLLAFLLGLNLTRFAMLLLKSWASTGDPTALTYWPEPIPHYIWGIGAVIFCSTIFVAIRKEGAFYLTMFFWGITLEQIMLILNIPELYLSELGNMIFASISGSLMLLAAFLIKREQLQEIFRS